ncbi:carboxylating nicotinate-nucleotide diphosphorylase [Natroniella sulfidigena]|uniref:carboxylating nicotinate-nucleotide diphosphorylase n=1 Tax=Natroniella sulfidigena TaxID=723921 RepID=UPI00200B1DC4|nr:carboxylating nicotinate-nucleotide diphosphorylase [Natroniella sulfidigena]MCK8817313.1 carboxylating nicotinate-nucleotide diphosphorylase [Natroniella sulfidigena]
MRLTKRNILKIIKNALTEDIGRGDITTEALIGEDKEGVGQIIAKDCGVIAGLDVASWVYKELDSDLKFEALVADGERVEPGQVIAKISGFVGPILTGERVALNFLQRMSGIATKTAKYQEQVADYDLKIVDTRKTTPGLRVLEKYAVKVGGGANHRFGLYDAVMIKDNHIQAAGSIKKAVTQIKENLSHTTKIEVEVENLTEVEEALAEDVDIIMLDNMSFELMEEAVELIAGKAIVEASGGITIDDLVNVAETGVDIISLGTLTHTIKSLDISLDLKGE